MNYRAPRSPKTFQNKARIARLKDKLARLRDRIKHSVLQLSERRLARFAWWQRAFRRPALGVKWLFQKAMSLTHAFLTVLGLTAIRSRNQPALNSRKTKSYSSRRQIFRAAVGHEQLEGRAMMATFAQSSANGPITLILEQNEAVSLSNSRFDGQTITANITGGTFTSSDISGVAVKSNTDQTLTITQSTISKLEVRDAGSSASVDVQGGFFLVPIDVLLDDSNAGDITFTTINTVGSGTNTFSTTGKLSISRGVYSSGTLAFSSQGKLAHNGGQIEGNSVSLSGGGLDLNGQIENFSGAMRNLTLNARNGKLSVGANKFTRALSIAITADDFDVQSDLQTLGGTITIATSPGRKINLGSGTTDPADVDISSASLSRLKADFLRISTTGDIDVTGGIDVTSSVSTLSLVAGGNITATSASSNVKAGNLALQADGAISLDKNNALNVLAAKSTSSAVNIKNNGNLSLGTVDNVKGISAATTVSVNAAGQLTLADTTAAPDISGPSGVTLSVDDVVINGTVSAGTSSIKVTGSTANRPINLGSTTPASTLNLNSTELGKTYGRNASHW